MTNILLFVLSFLLPMVTTALFCMYKISLAQSNKIIELKIALYKCHAPVTMMCQVVARLEISETSNKTTSFSISSNLANEMYDTKILLEKTLLGENKLWDLSKSKDQ